jgi:hypothetical protein
MSICPDDEPEVFEKIYHFMLTEQDAAGSGRITFPRLRLRCGKGTRPMGRFPIGKSNPTQQNTAPPSLMTLRRFGVPDRY